MDGIREVFVKGAGYTFESKTSAIRERLQELVDDEELRTKMGAKGKGFVCANSWRNVTKKTVDVCKTVLEKKQ